MRSDVHFTAVSRPLNGLFTAVYRFARRESTRQAPGLPADYLSRTSSTLVRKTLGLTTKSRSIFALSALFLVAVLMLPTACGGADKVVIATIGNYHPFDFVNDEGEIDGLERELGDELCRRAGLECEWVLNEWEMMIPDLLAEEFDAIFSGMSITAKREELIDFTEAYYPPTPSIYVARAGAGDEAAEGTIGIAENTIYSDYFTELGMPYVALDINGDAVDAVLNGEVDAVLVDHGYGVEKLAQHKGRLETVGPSVLLDRGLGIGVRKGGELKNKLDEALASMKSDGTLNALIVKWVGEDASTFE